jgi:hypothetical protein
MKRLRLLTQLPRLPKLPKSSVKCGTTLIRPPRTDLKSSTKRTRRLQARPKPSISQNTAKLKRRRKEKTKRNDSCIPIIISP